MIAWSYDGASDVITALSKSLVKRVDKHYFMCYRASTMSLIDQVALSRKAAYRLKQILKMRKQKMSMEAIGLSLNISKQRVSQILKKNAGTK